MRGPLSQIRVSLVASLGAAQIIFLGGIGATENKVRNNKRGYCKFLQIFLSFSHLGMRQCPKFSIKPRFFQKYIFILDVLA